MINTSALQTAVTASKLKATYLKYLDDAADIYGKDTPEYNAFKVLLDSDRDRFVDAQIKHLNEQLTRYSRECAEWLALLPNASRHG